MKDINEYCIYIDSTTYICKYAIGFRYLENSVKRLSFEFKITN